MALNNFFAPIAPEKLTGFKSTMLGNGFDTINPVSSARYPLSDAGFSNAPVLVPGPLATATAIHKCGSDAIDEVFSKNDKQIIFLKSFSYFLVFFLNRGSKKIVFVAQPFYAISYIFLNRFILACYDCHYGLPKINSIKLFLEEFILKKIESIIHRDLRLWKIYKPTLKTKKNILIPDHLSTNLNNPNLLNKKNLFLKQKIQINLLFFHK